MCLSSNKQQREERVTILTLPTIKSHFIWYGAEYIREAASEGDGVYVSGLQGTYRVVSVKSKCCVEYNKVF